MQEPVLHKAQHEKIAGKANKEIDFGTLEGHVS